MSEAREPMRRPSAQEQDRHATRRYAARCHGPKERVTAHASSEQARAIALAAQRTGESVSAYLLRVAMADVERQAASSDGLTVLVGFMAAPEEARSYRALAARLDQGLGAVLFDAMESYLESETTKR